ITAEMASDLFAEAPVRALVPQPQMERAQLAVWVLNTNVTEPEPEDVYRAGKSDTFKEAYSHLLAEIKKNKLEFVYEKIELPLMQVLRKMETKGVRIDRQFLKELSKK